MITKEAYERKKIAKKFSLSNFFNIYPVPSSAYTNQRQVGTHQQILYKTLSVEQIKYNKNSYMKN